MKGWDCKMAVACLGHLHLDTPPPLTRLHSAVCGGCPAGSIGQLTVMRHGVNTNPFLFIIEMLPAFCI